MRAITRGRRPDCYGRDLREGDERKHCWEEALYAPTERVLKRQCVSKRLAQRPQPLFKGMVLGHANLLEFSCKQARGRPLLSPDTSLLIKRVDLLRPKQQPLSSGFFFFRL